MWVARERVAVAVLGVHGESVADVVVAGHALLVLLKL